MKYSKDRSLRDQLTIAESGKTDRDGHISKLLAALRRKAMALVWGQNGPAHGYYECATGADRPLSHRAWAELLTSVEVRELLAIDAFPQGELANRLARQLAKIVGITPAASKRGRQEKATRPKSKRTARSEDKRIGLPH